MLVKRIINWNDKRFDDLLDSNKKGFVADAKAFGIGAVEGFIDAAVVIGAVVIAKDIVKDAAWIVKKIVKK